LVLRVMPVREAGVRESIVQRTIAEQGCDCAGSTASTNHWVVPSW
jgi:hypothetical protein